MSIFEIAARKQLRFDSAKGLLTAEDLWTLPLASTTGKVNLDDIAKALHRQLKNSDEISFVLPTSNVNSDLQVKFDIVKHIIETKLAENASKIAESGRAEQKQKILAIMARKQDGALEELSVEELAKMAASL